MHIYFEEHHFSHYLLCYTVLSVLVLNILVFFTACNFPIKVENEGDEKKNEQVSREGRVANENGGERSDEEGQEENIREKMSGETLTSVMVSRPVAL